MVLTYCIFQLSMDHDLNAQTEEAPPGTRSEDDLLNTLVEAGQELEAVRVKRHSSRALGPAGDGEEDEEGGRSPDEEQAERGRRKGVLRALRDLSVRHSERVAAWREVCVFHGSPPGGRASQPGSSAGAESHCFSDTLKSVGEDSLIVLDTLRAIVTKLDAEILRSCAEEASTDDGPPSTRDDRDPDSTAEDGGEEGRTSGCSHVEESGEQLDAECEANPEEGSRVDLQEKETRTENDTSKEETKTEWITVGAEDSRSQLLEASFIRAPLGVAAALRCESADALSGLMGTLAEVRVYSLGVFAVVSCLKRERYSVPSRGLSLKLSTDPRVSLSYLPGSFTAPVMAQVMVQPVDAILLAAVRSRSDGHRSVVSTSPLLHLTHPTSQPLRRPLSVTLPCPPNPERKKDPRGPREEKEHQHTSTRGSAPPQDGGDSHKVRIVQASKETSSELLVALGSKDKHWNVLEKVHVRNQQNGLVSLELTESVDRLLVARLLPPLQPGLAASFALELERAACSHAVAVVLGRRGDDPRGVLVAALPSRELGWERNRLRAQGYGELLEASPEVSMCEGDQLLLRFSGNVASAEAGSGTQRVECVTFHSQRRNHLLVQLTEVDPFGNYSSPHYKGTLLFFKVARGQLLWSSDGAFPVNTAPPDADPVCKLPLTLPKKARNINRPIAAKVKLCGESDSLPDALLLWLSAELSEDDLAPLAASLRLRRGAAQLVKLRAGSSLSAHAFHVLAMWRRGLPAAPAQPKAAQLAQGLARSGRPDLARELLQRQAAAAGRRPLQHGAKER
ncbi:death domain-containing protein 1 isoform X3 [Betta splendens]|uniref:Death domain-containing protein 1 isoform X3 n=1 Tax=Betta splendens TaxID=158456 RepID=A0A9W2XMZ4_BETSP|nr:death domain-containing protein 1 isoform X3 [Betta splendens]